MEIPEVKYNELLLSRHYLIVTYRNGKPCGYQLYDGIVIGSNRGYWEDGEDASGNSLTSKFFLLPETIR
jgi:hypothetical protein